MNEYDIQENWTSIALNLPQSGTRCLVTDGEIIDIATYVNDGEKFYWVFGNLQEKHKEYNVIGWMILPRQMKITEKVSAYVGK